MDIIQVEIKRLSIRGHVFLQPLKQLVHAPKSLYIKGHIPANRPPIVAIVGTRKPTSYGTEVTFQLAYNLAKRGVVIVSGLAYGVDAIAHKAALEAGGTTIAVLANGLDTVYPVAHQGLARDILSSGGALVSEYPEGTGARQFQFLARNRIVSGLADAVIVTEAGERSGTLSTVNHALDQNKEVFAVPGNITSLLSIGPNRLIQQGAHPALKAEDILAVIAPHLLEPQTALALGTNPAEIKIIILIQQGVRDREALQQQSGLSASEFATTLTMLEINGTIRQVGGNQWGIR